MAILKLNGRGKVFVKMLFVNGWGKEGFKRLLSNVGMGERQNKIRGWMLLVYLEIFKA